MAKDFSSVKAGRSKVQQEIEQAAEVRKPGQQGTAGPDEQRQRAEEMKTSGRKGCHMPRINLAFTPTNYQYVRIVSKLRGESLTAFVNWVMEQYRLEHPELYRGVLDLIDKAAAEKATAEKTQAQPQAEGGGND